MGGGGRNHLPAMLVALGVLAAAVGTARANQLVADLSQHLIAITTAFVGSEVVLFGTTDGDGAVVVLLEGPRFDQTVRKKSRVAGIWVNREEVTFADAPSYYAIASSAPLADIARSDVQTSLQLGTDHLKLVPVDRSDVSDAELAAFRAAFIRNKERQRLFRSEIGEVTFLGPRLFRTNFEFPANVAPGLYRVQVFQLKDGHVSGAQRSTLVISKIGFEAEIYDFAHQQSALYGLIAILLAVTIGWLAGVIFRRA